MPLMWFNEIGHIVHKVKKVSFDLIKAVGQVLTCPLNI